MANSAEFRTCPDTGLLFHKPAETLMKLNAVAGVNVQSVAPVEGSRAMIWPGVETTNIRPSFTSGVASVRSGTSMAHAPPNCLMFFVLIWLSVE